MSGMKQSTLFQDVDANDDFGTEPKFLVRATDPGTSQEAAASVDTACWERRVLTCIAQFASGAIQDDILEQMEKLYGKLPYSTVTARFAALSSKGLIEYTGEKRRGKSGRPSRVRLVTKSGARLIRNGWSDE